MIYPIVFEPEAMLHRLSKNLMQKDIASKEIQTFIKDMALTMYAKNGVGLAAVQVGKPLMLCTILKTYNTLNPRKDLVLINPTWQKISRHQAWDQEGCLSVPRIYGQIKRYTKIKVKAWNEHGEPL